MNMFFFFSEMVPYKQGKIVLSIIYFSFKVDIQLGVITCM